MSHSLVAAGIIGLCCAGFGWVIGTYITDTVANWLLETIVVGPLAIEWVKTHLATLDAGLLIVVGFCLGSGGICLHLLGDVITRGGIRPYLPFSRRKVSLTPLYANNTLVNRGLFGGGVLAIVALGLVLTPLGELLVELLDALWQAVITH